MDPGGHRLKGGKGAGNPALTAGRYTLNVTDPNGKADTESFKAELVKAVKAARAVLEEAEESQLSFSSLYSALLEHLHGQPRSGVRDSPR